MTTKIKIYSFKTENRKMMNNIFDCLQAQERLKFIKEATFFNYSIFVI